MRLCALRAEPAEHRVSGVGKGTGDGAHTGRRQPKTDRRTKALPPWQHWRLWDKPRLGVGQGHARGRKRTPRKWHQARSSGVRGSLGAEVTPADGNRRTGQKSDRRIYSCQVGNSLCPTCVVYLCQVGNERWQSRRGAYDTSQCPCPMQCTSGGLSARACSCALCWLARSTSRTEGYSLVRSATVRFDETVRQTSFETGMFRGCSHASRSCLEGLPRALDHRRIAPGGSGQTKLSTCEQRQRQLRQSIPPGTSR